MYVFFMTVLHCFCRVPDLQCTSAESPRMLVREILSKTLCVNTPKSTFKTPSDEKYFSTEVKIKCR